MRPAHILIGTPTANGDLCVEYCETIVQLLGDFRDRYPEVTFDVRFIETYDLRVVRNAYASMVLNDPRYTHLLFFDSDMGFFPSLIEKMLAADKPVVGVVSPKRGIDEKKVAALSKRFKDIRIVEIAANDYIPEKSAYTIGYAEDGETPVHVAHEGSYLTVKRCGTGIMLIHRSVLEAFRDRIPEDYDPVAPPLAAAYGVEGGYLRCFDAVASNRGTTLGEDYAFSDRWVKRLGGIIHLVFDEIIFHVGERRTIGNAAVKYGNKCAGRI